MPGLDVAFAGFGIPWQVIVGFFVGAIIAEGLRRSQKAAPRVHGSKQVLHCPRVLPGFFLVVVLLFGGLFGSPYSPSP